MNVTQIIAQLREERASLEQAIAVLEKIARAGPRGRGRPPSWLSASVNSGPKRTFSAATRKRMAEAQRKRWAAYRKEKEGA
jgi:hypothetical protein